MCLNFHDFVRFFNSFVDLSKKTWSKLTEKCNSKKEHLLKTLSEASFLFRNQLYPENCHEFIFSKNTITSFRAFPSFKPNTSKKLPFWCIIKFMLTLGEIWGQNWYNVDSESPICIHYQTPNHLSICKTNIYTVHAISCLSKFYQI